MFNAPVFTTAGKALLTRNISGEQIKFTTIQMGSGYISGSIDAMTALVKVEATVSASAKNEDGQYVNVSAAFTNQGLENGFYWREIGVFAANPSFPNDRSKDILYCYQNAYDTAEFIPPPSAATIEKGISIPIIVGDTSKVSAMLDKTLILATQKDLEDHNKNPNAHGPFYEKIQNWVKEQLKNFTGMVKTINGGKPDESGNIDLNFMPKSGGTFTGRINFFSGTYFIDGSNQNGGSASLRNLTTTGTISSTGSIHSGGNIDATGYVTGAKTYHGVYNDYAELFPRGEETRPGDIIALDLDSQKERYVKATRASRRVVGVHSDEFATLIGGKTPTDGSDLLAANEKDFIPVSLAGRVRTWVIGPVHTGDLIVPSTTPGVGCAPQACISPAQTQVVGYAVEGDDRTDLRRIRVRIGG